MSSVTDIRNEGARLFSEALKSNTSLICLNLDSDEYKRALTENEEDNCVWTVNNIENEGARILSEALKTNTTLTELNLGCNKKELNERLLYDIM